MDYLALKAELLAGHPVTGPYNANNKLAADELNALNREAPAEGRALLQYLTLERFRTGFLYGRLYLIANHSRQWNGTAFVFPPLPMGAADADVTITQEHISAAAALLRYVDVDTDTIVSLLDTRFDAMLNDLTPSGGCEAIGPADKTAIQALSQNQQSRAIELGFGRVNEGDVAQARSI